MMLKLALGLILGLTISAVAQSGGGSGSTIAVPSSKYPIVTPSERVYVNAGVSDQQGMAPIRVDDQGRVYCSPHELPEAR